MTSSLGNFLSSIEGSAMGERSLIPGLNGSAVMPYGLGLDQTPPAIYTDPSQSVGIFFDKFNGNSGGVFGGNTAVDQPDTNSYIHRDVFVDMQKRNEFDSSVSQLCFLSRNPPKYKKGTAPVYVNKCVGALNHFLRSKDGRMSYGRDRTAERLLDDWGFFGSQVAPLKDLGANDNKLTFRFAKRAVCGYYWASDLNYQGSLTFNGATNGSKLYFIARRHHISDRRGEINPNDWSRKGTFYNRKRKREIEETQLIHTNKRSKPVSTASAALHARKQKLLLKEYNEDDNDDDDDPNECNYYWCLEPEHYEYRAPGILEYCSFHPTRHYVGHPIPVGMLLQFLTKFGPDGSGQMGNIAKQALYPKELDANYIQDYNSLPHVELMLRFG